MEPRVEILSEREAAELLDAANRHDRADLMDLAYTPIGALRYSLIDLGLAAQAVVLIGPSRDRAAAVVPTTPMTAFGLSSFSADGRGLRSRRDSFLPEPEWVLCNDMPGATVRQLHDAHSDVLERVRDHWEPDVYAEGATIEQFAKRLDEYLRGIEGMNRSLYYRSSEGAITDDRRSVRKIERWTASMPPGV